MRLAFEDWKNKPMRAITEDMVLDRFTKLSESPSRANHHMRLLQALFHYAIPRLKRADGSVVLSSSPVTILGYAKAWHRDTRRKSYIRETDLPKWWTAVETLGGLAPGHNDLIARDYLRLLLLTGLRRNEGATLEWRRVDFKQRTLHIPMELTKNNDLPEFLEIVQIVGNNKHHRRRGHADEEGKLADVQPPRHVPVHSREPQPVLELPDVVINPYCRKGTEKDKPCPVFFPAFKCLLKHDRSLL